MKQNKLSILFPYQEEVTYRESPEESWHDLGMDALTEKVASQPQEVQLLRRVMMNLTADPRVAAFRSDVCEDMLLHPEIRERMVFLQDGNRSKPYQLFMNNLYAFTVAGKQAKHDDAPDSCAMVCEMAFHSYARAEVISRPF